MGLMGGKKKKSRDLRIFFASDIHGSERCFRKFLAAAEVYGLPVLMSYIVISSPAIARLFLES